MPKANAEQLLKRFIHNLANSGAIGVDDEDNIVFLGEALEDNRDDGGRIDFDKAMWDDNGFSIEMTEFGGRQIQALEEYRATLPARYAKKIKDFHMVSPIGSRNLVQNDTLFEQLIKAHGWDRSAVSNADKNIAHVTFIAMGSDMSGPAWDYSKDPSVFLANHSAYSVQLTRSSDIVEYWKGVIEDMKKPRRFDFSPREP